MANADKKKSPQPGKIKLKLAGNNAVASDSDASAETNSLSAESATEQAQPAPVSKKKQRRRSSEWEIMEGLKEGQRYESKPEVFNGFLHKKRKWPLKGWHKRYFVLDKGILIYGKGPPDINRGKIHGSVDIGLSVISSKVKRRRIDIDAEEFIYHLKAKTEDTFINWVKQLTIHRLYRQHVLTYGAKVKLVPHITNDCDSTPEIISRDGSLTRGLKPLGSSGSRLATWLLDSGPPLEKAQHEACVIEKNISKLSQLLQQIEIFSVSNTGAGDSESLGDGLSPAVKKDRKKFGLKKKKSSKGGSVDLTMTFNKNVPTDPDNTSPLSNNSSTGLSSSPQYIASANNNSFISSGSATLPIPCVSQSLPASDNLSCNLDMQMGSTDNHLKEDFLGNAKSVLKDLKNLHQLIRTERDRLKAALDAEMKIGSGLNQNLVYNLESSLNQALQQNSEMKKRLLRIHEVSDIADLSTLDPISDTHRPFNASLSYSSSCASEFFDAEELPTDKQRDVVEESSTLHMEYMDQDIRTHGSDSSSEAGSLSSGEGSLSSESELGTEFNAVNNFVNAEGGPSQGLTGRRTTLPAPRPDTEGLSLWNLLCKNIGKDLSQISMPVALNEPLNMLQRLCEELEYSELLDKASEVECPYERMVQIAAFAVSSYASSYSRAGNKPFNPLLGETYECVREDKGFRFVAEQVSHHPPISACYAESKNYTFWQEARIKTKFWGKSMEIQPLGEVHVLLSRTGDLYTWNKVTTCVHNLFSGQRWVDQYGELRISNGQISCKLTFAKASYWSAKRHEVVGAVYDESGKPVRQLFGKWSEALYCGVAPAARCIWRAGTMPPDHQRYYGFTRFAMELNELGPDSYLLPPTDTRLRPDQRALEEGDLNAAEQLKSQLENTQRERRKRREEMGFGHEPKWFSHRKQGDEDVWQYNGKYWETRRNPGFGGLQFEALW